MEAETKPEGAEPLGGDAPGEDAEVHTDAATQDSSISNGDDADGQQEMVDLKIIWNKNKYDLKIPIDDTGAKLKESIHSLTGKALRSKTDVTFDPHPPPPRKVLQRASMSPAGLPPAMQKVMYKGLLPEDKTLREIKVTNGAKIMVVGSTINDVLAVNTPKEVIQQEVKAEENKKEPLCRQKVRQIASLTLLRRFCFLNVCVCVVSFQQHRKVLDKGKPDDIMTSMKGVKVRRGRK